MKKMGWILGFVVMLVISSPCQAQEWAYLYDPPARGHNIQQTSTGDYLLFGGPTILTISPNGTVAGNAYVAGAYGLTISSTEQTPDQGFIFAGNISGYEVAPYGWHGLAVFKTNADGTIAWANKYHHYEQGMIPNAYCIQNTPDGGYIVGGEKQSYMDDPQRSCILKLNSTGLVEWYREMNDDTRPSNVKALRVTADNGYVVAGYFDLDETSKSAWLAKLDASGNFEWEKVFDGAPFYSVEETSEGGYIAVGQGYYPNWGYRVLKVDSFGDLEWHKAYDTFYLYGSGQYSFQRHGYATAIQETDDNGYVVVGYRENDAFNEADVLMLKLDALGNVQWNRVLGGLYTAKAFSVRQTTDGGYLIAGQRATEPYPDNAYAAWLIKTNENGDVPTCGEMAIADVTVTSLFNEGENAAGNWSSTTPYRIEIDVTREADASVSRSNGCPIDSICKCNLVPDNTTVSRGGTLGFQVSVTNNTGGTGTVLFGTKVTKPDASQTGFIWGPIQVYLNPNQTKSGHKTHTIPTGFDLGTYTYHGYVGRYSNIYDECQFDFEVVP